MSIESQIKEIVLSITEKQAEVLRKYLSAVFLLGFRQTGADDFGNLQKEQIKKIYREQLGYLGETNQLIGKAMKTAIKDRIKQGGGYEEISNDLEKFVTEAFGAEGVTIDRTGQVRDTVEVGKDGTLRRVQKEITRSYHSTVQAYSDMLGRTSTHAALEAGRGEGYKQQGVKQVRFVGSNDEISRAWHVALLGNVYDVGSEDYFMALDVLSEPNCRHRFIPFFDDQRYDTPQEKFDEMKEKSGLTWDDENEQWSFAEKT